MRRPGSDVYLDALTHMALLAVVGVGAAAFIRPLAAPAELLYPVSALVAAALLLWRKPALYLGFMWWVWFLTPAVRRVVDYSTSYSEASLVMLAPFLVTGVALIPTVTQLHKLAPAYRLPLAFTACGLLYGYTIGVLNNSLAAATFDLLNWGVPLVGGAYVLTHPQLATAFRQATRQAFLWGMLVMGLYGLVQFIYVPAWDAYWMLNADLGSIGFPEPYQVRVFSTLNSPGPFAVVLMAGLLLALSEGRMGRWLAAASGLVGFALSGVRAAWGGWVVGLLLLSVSLPPRLRLRLLGSLVALSIVALPLFLSGPVADLFTARLTTVTDLESDMSFNARLNLYGDISRYIIDNPLGQGLGGTGSATTLNSGLGFQDLDSGIIATLYTFGFLGALYYAGGAAVLFGRVLSTTLRSRTLPNATYASIAFAALSQLVFGNAWTGVTGLVTWFFACLYLATEEAQRGRATPARAARPEVYGAHHLRSRAR